MQAALPVRQAAVEVKVVIVMHAWRAALPLRRKGQFLHGFLLLQDLKAAAAAVTVGGIITAALASAERWTKVVKGVSDLMLQGSTFMHLKDHSSKIGYQHEVS